MTSDVEILGELVTWQAGTETIPSRMTKRVLALLIVERNQAVADAELIDRLWGHARPAHALASLRNSVARLRKLLPEGAIERRGDGYRLVATRVTLDADRFDALVQEARRCLAGDAADAAMVSLDDALALVRGAPFGGIGDESWAVPAATALAERIALAEELWAEIRLRTRRAGRELARLREATEAHPERELRWHQLMLAYAQSGRRTEAIRAAADARRELAEFGMVPGAELVELEQEILAIDATPGPAQTGLGADGLVSSTGPMIDRVSELGTCRTLLDDTRQVTLVGPGGAGKTRLAVEVARDIGDRFDQVVLVDLAPINRDDQVPRAAADALGLVDGDSAGTVLERISRAIGDAPTLVVVDNAEHVLVGVKALVRDLLANCRAVRVLVTSRQALGTADEVAMMIEPLGLPAENATGAELEAAPSVQMLRMLAPQIPTSPETSAILGRISRCVDGLPLGLELVARMLRSLSPIDVADELERWGARVLPGDDGRSHRQRSLAVVTEWAIDQLSPSQRAVFARTSLLADRFTLATAEYLGDTSDPDEPVIGSVLRLVELGLLTTDGTSIPGVYRHRVLSREHASAHLQRSGCFDSVRDRQVQWYVTMAAAEGAAMLGSGQVDARRWLEAEWGNLSHLLQQLPEEGRWNDAADIAACLGALWFVSGRWSEGPEHVRRLLDLSPGPFGVRDARLVVALAESIGTYAGLGALGDLLGRAAAVLEDDGAPEVMAACQLYLAVCLVWRGDVSAFHVHRDRAEEIAMAHGIESVLAAILKFTGLVAGLGGDLLTTRAQLHESARRSLAMGDRARAANTLLNLGMFLQRHDGPTSAEVELQECLRLADGLDMHSLETHVRFTLGQIAAERGDARAELQLLIAREELRRAGDVGCRNGCNRHLALIHRRSGRDDIALSFLRDSLEDVASADDQELAMSLIEVADVYRGRGRQRDAAAIVAAACRATTGTGIGLNVVQRTRLDTLVQELGSVDAPPLDVAVALALA